MTEAEWLACTDLAAMLEFLGDRASERKLWLFTCTCCRRIPGYLELEPDRQGLELAENFADGLATDEDFADLPDEEWDIRWYRRDCWDAVYRAMESYWFEVWDSRDLLAATEQAQAQVPRYRDAKLAALLFDIFGNPFRPVPIGRKWLTPTVLALAQAAYDDLVLPAGTLDLARFGVLADALEEAGCTNADILSHLRGPGPHVRGCWAIDLILGKQSRPSFQSRQTGAAMRSLVLTALSALLLAAGRAPAEGPFKDWPQSSLTGTVRDADGKPIHGAKVHLNNARGPHATLGGNWAFTDADGKYALRVFVKPDSQALVTEVIVSAKGFVQLRERFLLEELVLRPGKKTEANFTLARGEVLGGKIDIPLHGAEKAVGVKPEERQFAFAVRGPSFKEYFLTEKGGRFEVWVPKGKYTIEAAMGSGRAAVRRENVPSGSADLKLVPTYSRPGAAALGKAFDALWDDMDRHYSHFALKKIDWKALKDRYRPRAVAAADLREFVEVLAEMLGHLRDGHVWIDFEGRVPTHVSRADGNYNREVVQKALKDVTYCGNFAFVGVTKADGFASLVLTHQSKADQESVRQAVAFIRAHRDAPGFLVDLREANGGNELLAREVAREFCGKDAVYAKSKYRAGPGHEDFGPVYDRVLKAGERPYTKPVVCLIGPRAVSSGEGFVQMLKCLPHVTTVGARTRGASGNPRPFALPGVAVTVWYSRWIDMLPDGTPIEGAGIAPAVAVAAPPAAYREKDPTWEKAVEVLRQKASRGKPTTPPGGRDD